MTRFTDLIEGYRRFRTDEWFAEHQRWTQLAEGQSPKVMILACSDSRVDPMLDVHVAERKQLHSALLSSEARWDLPRATRRRCRPPRCRPP